MLGGQSVRILVDSPHGVESIFDLIIDYAIVACDSQLILTLGNHAMIPQYIKNHVMVLQ